MAEQMIWKQEKGNRSIGQWWIRALLVSALYLLLTWGIVRMVSNVLGLAQTVCSLKFLMIMLLSTLGINLWVEGSVVIAQKSRKKIGNILFGVGPGILLGFAYGGSLDKLREGFLVLWNTYLSRWNAQSEDFRAGNGKTAEMLVAVELLVLVLLWLMQIMGGLKRKRSIVLVLPACIVCIGLWVMAVPQWSDIGIMLVSGALLLYFDSMEQLSWKRLAVLMAGVLLLTGGTGGFAQKAEKQMLALNEKWFDFWENKGSNVETIFDFQLTQWPVDRDVIDNSSPQFKEKEVMQLTISQKPVGSVYLRGYHCKDYVDGAWEKDTKAFAEACKEYGICESEAAKELLWFQHEKEDIPGNQQVTYELNYTGIKSVYFYFPYGVGWEEVPEDYELSQDYLIQKKRSKKEGSAIGWRQLRYAIPMTEGVEEYSSLQSWYDVFVYENYLTVPKEQKAAKELAEELKKQEEISAYLAYLKPGSSTFDMVNRARLQVAYQVAVWLQGQGVYSLELDELSRGEDAIEYFLETSWEGYCEHFASAGTLILRQLGIPARYTTGYLAFSDSMVESHGRYMASVLDSAAHAWTEIYLDNYGWVPIEMTPGYSGMDISEPEAVVTPKPQQPQISPQEPELEETLAPTRAPQNTPTEAPEEDTEETKPLKDVEIADGGEDSKEEQETSGFWAGVALLCVVMGGFLGYRYYVATNGRGRNRLNGYIRRGENRRAVKWINEEIYTMLVQKGRKFKNIVDAAYLQALKSEFPEVEPESWDAYFEVVRRAVYSVEKITGEEVQRCYEIYQSVRQNPEQKVSKYS